MGRDKEVYIEAIRQLVRFEAHEAYVIACQEQARKDVYRKWFLAGHLPKDNPKYRDDNEELRKAARLAFIGPVAPITADPESIRYSHTSGDTRMYTGDYEAVTTRAERKRLERLVETATQTYQATPEGQAEVHLWCVIIWTNQVIREAAQWEQQALHLRCLRKAPHRLHLSVEHAQHLLAEHQQRKADSKAYPALYRYNDDGDDMPRYRFHNVQSEEEGQHWKARNEGYRLPYLEYVTICEKAEQEAPTLLEYRRLQRQYKKSQPQPRKPSPRRSKV